MLVKRLIMDNMDLTMLEETSTYGKAIGVALSCPDKMSVCLWYNGDHKGRRPALIVERYVRNFRRVILNGKKYFFELLRRPVMGLANMPAALLAVWFSILLMTSILST